MPWRAKCYECQQEAGIAGRFSRRRTYFWPRRYWKSKFSKRRSHTTRPIREARPTLVRAARSECRCRAPTCSSPIRQRPMKIRRLGGAKRPVDRARHQTDALPSWGTIGRVGSTWVEI